MKSLFKKYYNSILNAHEFSKVSRFLETEENDPEISYLMKPLWDESMRGDVHEQGSNPALFERIKNKILIEKWRHHAKKMNFYVWGFRAASVLIITLVISEIFLFYNNDCSLSGNVQKQTISTPLGAKTSFTLPDGSLVWLNSGSTLTYPVNFQKSRNVKLLGEAYFQVVKDDEPFIVSTKYGNVIVKGTSFNVKAFSDDCSFETTLEEGSVLLTDKKNMNAVTLKPNEQAKKLASGFQVETVDVKCFTSWKEGKLVFNREAFPDFVKKLERWYNVHIAYSDMELDTMWYTGTIEMESISEVMEMIRKSAPVNYTFNHKTRVFTLQLKE